MTFWTVVLAVIAAPIIVTVAIYGLLFIGLLLGKAIDFAKEKILKGKYL